MPLRKKDRRPVQIIGVPMDLGAGRRGVDMGPSAIRIAGVQQKLEHLGYSVRDIGNIDVKEPEGADLYHPKLKYLPAIARACGTLARTVERTLEEGMMPLVLGGDHAIAIGTMAGVSAFCKKKRKKLGVLWIDAHGDINTEKTSPSGNVHGMSLAASIGIGSKELRDIGGPGRKVDPEAVVMLGTRDLDQGERDAIRKNNINIFTMEQIDTHGMAAVMGKVRATLTDCDMVYISLDLDALDPSITPGVGTPVRGGLSYREAHHIMETMNEFGKTGVLEVVEMNPALDERNTTAELAVELVLSALGKRIY